MNYIFLVVSVLAGVHGYTFVRWLWHEGNQRGALGVLVLIFISLLLPIYQIISTG